MEDVLGDSRKIKNCSARAFAMLLIRAKFDDSYPRIARLFGRDHSCVINSISRTCGYPLGKNKRAGAGHLITTTIARLRPQLTALADHAIALDESAKQHARAQRAANAEEQAYVLRW
jgi:hypothetical protein